MGRSRAAGEPPKRCALPERLHGWIRLCLFGPPSIELCRAREVLEGLGLVAGADLGQRLLVRREASVEPDQRLLPARHRKEAHRDLLDLGAMARAEERGQV